MNLDELKKNGFKIVTNWQECNKKSIFLFNSTDNKKFSIYKNYSLPNYSFTIDYIEDYRKINTLLKKFKYNFNIELIKTVSESGSSLYFSEIAVNPLMSENKKVISLLSPPSFKDLFDCASFSTMTGDIY